MQSVNGEVCDLKKSERFKDRRFDTVAESRRTSIDSLSARPMAGSSANVPSGREKRPRSGRLARPGRGWPPCFLNLAASPREHLPKGLVTAGTAPRKQPRGRRIFAGGRWSSPHYSVARNRAPKKFARGRLMMAISAGGPPYARGNPGIPRADPIAEPVFAAFPCNLRLSTGSIF